MATSRRRSQPYRLDWQGNASNLEDLNRRLRRFWTDADEMFQILFDDLRRADEAINANAAVASNTQPPQFVFGLDGQDGLDGETIFVGGMGGATVSAAQIQSAGYWSPLTDGYEPDPELVFANGDTIAVWTPTP